MEQWNKEQTWVGRISPSTYVAEGQLGLHMGPNQLEWGYQKKLFILPGIYPFSWATFLSSERDEVPGFGHTGSPKLLRGEVEEGQGETVGLGDQEGVTELDVNIRKKLN